MEHENQERPAAPEPPAGVPGASQAPPGALIPLPPSPGGLLPDAGTLGRVPGARGLVAWLVILAVVGFASALLGQSESAALVVLAGLFVSAQAADLDLTWTGLYRALAWVTGLGGIALLVLLAIAAGTSPFDVPGLPRSFTVGLATASAALCLLTAVRSFTRRLTAWLLGTADSHTLRLTARLVFLSIVLAVPAWFLTQAYLDRLLAAVVERLEPRSLVSGVVGDVVLALAGVGFLVRRDLRATLERLGLRRLTLAHALAVLLGVAVLFAFNAGADWFQQHFLPALWAGDQRVNHALARGLAPASMLLLGVSAGVGEEITMRGALQPRLGVALTALLFAVLHVQYSAYGMGVIFALGVILGWIRNRTSTTVAILVHALYDMLALFSN
jgi:membrane protease YdiL (CAAX protease family)